MIEIAMTPEQYAAARAALPNSAEVTRSTEVGSNAGTLSTRQVALSYQYDGVAKLAVSVTARFGCLATVMSEGMIRKRLLALMAKV